MKRFFLLLILCTAVFQLHAQISITSADMPVSGDTLRHSSANILAANIILTDSGANHSWDYSSLSPASQQVDTYKTAMQVNPLYAVTISPSAYGYKIADSFPLPQAVPVSVTNPYTFFRQLSNPSRFAAVAFAASIANIPTPANYSDDDEWYYFPLSYGNEDTSTFALHFGTAALGITQQGTRTTKVDGWGTIVTPYYTSPVNCIRLRSVVDEVDSITFNAITFPLPRNYVEYKWLANGEHYPALWVTADIAFQNNETIRTIEYRDSARPLAIATPKPVTTLIKVYPNPATHGTVNLDIPAAWQKFSVEVFDISGRLQMSTTGMRQLDVHLLPVGQYLVRISSGGNTAYAMVTR
ncbi:MAG: hypothetical protein BGO69_15580 [Bacteroidetes bacterium 46-16]|nr:MAG: hypothetical protein BGO69_15580 [Bacteroidetes bacterium 46-16]